MGSLKDEKRALSLKEDHQPSEKSDNRRHQAGSVSSTAAEGQPLQTSQESTAEENYQTNRHMNASDKNPTSKDQGISGADSEASHRSISEDAKDSTQTDVMSQPAARETTATQNEATVSINLPNDGDSEKVTDSGKETDIENISVPVPLTSDPIDPRSPAPLGQHHMRTQVSLEVVQCHSAATSPMTPPEGGNSFFFPSTFGKSQGVSADTKDAELQVGQQVEFCSVATSPMTPKTPSTSAFPVLVGRETVQNGEKKRKSKELNQSGHQQDFTTTKSQEADSVTTKSLSSKTSSGSSASCLGLGSVHSQGTCEDISQQCKQQRMGSLDQDITILVTQHGNNEEEEDKKEESHFPLIEPEMVKIEEESGETNEDRKKTVHAQDTSHSTQIQGQSKEAKDCSKAQNSKVTEGKGTAVKPIDVSGTKPPESPAPFGCHNIRTQVSLEVVQCQSAATSPMTPPEGDQAFYFPSSFGKCGAVETEIKDAELQVGQQVEFRSVATAPMTPRTPIATTFPEIKKDTSIEEKIQEEEEEENKKEQVMEGKEEEEKVEEDKKEMMNCEEKCEEPVQEVSWDEKGMTWEVYGAVVEVAVLGSAIQKHLEKQVLKQKQQSSIPPSDPLEAEQVGAGKGRARKKGERDGKVSRRRRNPFRVLMENVQQPHCCSRAHTNE